MAGPLSNNGRPMKASRAYGAGSGAIHRRCPLFQSPLGVRFGPYVPTRPLQGKRMASEKKTGKMEAKVAEKLLRLLSTDDQFRKQFVDDPSAALKKVGHKDQDGFEPFAACSRVQTLASKEVIADA